MARKKQVYKALTAAQGKKATSLAKKGKSQKAIAKSLGVAKQRVATFLKTGGVGKRAVGTFWGDVKNMQSLGYSWKDAQKKIYFSPKWTKKRALRKKKGYKTFQEFWAEQEEEYKSQQEKQQALTEEMEEFEFAS